MIRPSVSSYLAAVVVAIGLAASTPAAASSLAAAARRPDRPRAPGVTYLHDGVIHTATGDAVRVPMKAAQRPTAQLLGRSTGGWVVDVGDILLLVGDDGRVRSRFAASQGGLYGGTQLSDDGRSVLNWYQEGIREGSILDLRTRRRRGFEVGTGADLAMAGGKVFFGTYFDGLHVLDTASGRTRLASRREVMLVDTAHRVAFVRGRSGDGPTRLGAPSAPRWQRLFTALAVSPDGRAVVGRERDGGLVVRRMSDGTLVRRLRVAYDADDTGTNLTRHTLAWVGSDALAVVALEDPDSPTSRRALLTCSVRGRGGCDRRTPWSHDVYSLPRPTHP